MEDIIRKIKALLAKANSTDSEAEAMAFAIKAKELMDKHNVSNADIDDNRIGYKPQHKRIPDPWRGWIASSTARLFNCVLVTGWHRKELRNGRSTSEKGFIFYGREGERLTAEIMTDYFIGAVIRLGTAYKKANSPTDRDFRMYQKACALSLAQRIYDMSEKQADHQQLALVNEHIDQAADIVDGKASKVPALSGDAARAGFEDAQGIGLNLQAGTDAKGNLQIAQTLQIEGK